MSTHRFAFIFEAHERTLTAEAQRPDSRTSPSNEVSAPPLRPLRLCGEATCKPYQQVCNEGGGGGAPLRNLLTTSVLKYQTL